MSLTDVETVLYPPSARGPGRDDLGLGLGHGQGADQVDQLRRLAPGLAVLGGAGASDLDPTWATAGKSTHLGASIALTVRRTRLP